MPSSLDLLRSTLYRSLAATGVMPSFDALASDLGVPRTTVEAGVRELEARHVVVLAPDGASIERALPFSGVPTAFRVKSGDRAWFANCIWDALALPPLVGVDAVVETICPDCDDPISVHVTAKGGPDRPDLVAHFLLPASRWYEDVRFT